MKANAASLSLSIFILLLAIASGCTKNKNTNVTHITTHTDTGKAASFGFQINNRLMLFAIGDSVKFNGWEVNNVGGSFYEDAAGHKYLWDFGDGTSAVSNVAPGSDFYSLVTHIYDKPGIFTVNLTADDTVHAFGISITISPDPKCTHQICKLRSWTGGTRERLDGAHNIVPLSDTSFAMTYRSRLDIILPRFVFPEPQTVTYSSPDSYGNMYKYAGEVAGDTLYYNALTDSIGFSCVLDNKMNFGADTFKYRISWHTR